MVAMDEAAVGEGVSDEFHPFTQPDFPLTHRHDFI
jgi:hypothetical protein